MTRRFAIALGLFALVLAIGLLQPTGLFAPVDRLAMRIVAHLRDMPGAGAVTAGAQFLDRIGSGGGRLFILLVLGLFLACSGRPRTLIWLMGTAAAMILINPAVKLLFAAPRPDAIEPLLVVSSHSFPSGHAAGAIALYGAIALVWRSRLVATICAAMVLATGLSRVWLGVHWPSDVAGGWIQGTAWLIVMVLLLPRAEAAGRHGDGRDSRRP